MAKIRLIAITPKIAKLIDPNEVKKEIRFGLRNLGNTVKNDFKRTVRTWNNKPSFVQRGPFTLGDRITISVSTDNRIYFFVTKGTRAHTITARLGRGGGGRPGLLHFRSRFSPKTRPRVIGSRAGSKSGPLVSAFAVKHPGTEARDFDKEIARRRQKTLEKQFRNAILRSIRR